jgi:hypothetical protein
MKLFRFAVAAVFVALASPVGAQWTPQNVAVTGALLGATTSLAVSSSTANVALPGPANNLAIILTNDGSNEAFYQLGTSSGVTATTSSFPLPSGATICVAANYNNTPPTSVYSYIAAITSSSTTTLRVTQASACPPMVVGGTFSGSIGPVTQGTVPWVDSVYGPTAAGSAASTPPVIVGGTVDGTATGNVDNWKVASGIGSINTAQVNGVTTLAGTGAVGTGAQRIAVGTDTATIAGSAPSINLNTINGANTYNTIAASQTAQALTGGSGGASGDYLSHCVVVPTSTSPGVVTIADNSTSIIAFPGGSSSLSNLVPFTLPVGAKSTSGAWKVTTGANLSVACVGKFT